MSVFAYHAWFVGDAPRVVLGPIDVTGVLVSGGRLGVELFFVLSGFLLVRPWLGQAGGSIDVAGYAIRRFFRIVPLYYCSLLLLSIFRAPPPPGFPPPAVTPLVVAAHLVFAPFLALSPALNGVYWSLSTEVQFYAALPFIAPLFVRLRLTRGLIACFAASIAWRALTLAVLPSDGQSLLGVDPRAYLNMVMLPGRLDSFAMGMAAAYAVTRRQPSTTKRGDLLAVVGLALVAAALASDQLGGRGLGLWLYFLQPSCVALGIGLFVLGALSAGSLRDCLRRSRALRAIGLISYGVYLWHLPALTSSKSLLGPAGLGEGVAFLFLAGAAVAPLVLAASALTYLTIERPFVRLAAWLAGTRNGRWAASPAPSALA